MRNDNKKAAWAGTLAASDNVFNKHDYSTTGGIDNLLARLDKVKRTGNGTYQACCPAHDDRNPTLTLREIDDGKILLHCFAGCSTHEIVSALGLELSDLFPPRQHQGKPERRPFPAADVLRAIAFEVLVVASSGVSMLTGTFTGDDRERLILAVSRIQAALTAAGVTHG